ncbi:hypothetical protein Glove_420g87 [Diversispora epigaea]|uniref:BED-type domain-containing protein n=1 Tax=Diversispora epigaea TaxID=1348612 RepID=A0A397H422_9GLOM|nr:hypothetical protein Glove_420g87 [Diversispora epigaea]
MSNDSNRQDENSIDTGISSSNNSLSNNSLSEITANNQKKRKHPGGKKIGEIWNYFIKGTDLGREFYKAECRWCNKKWSREHPKDMKIHLARNFLLEEASNIHPQNAKQPQITKHFDRITSTIENLFIIDLFRIAIPGYTLPSRSTLSGKLLDQETIRIEKKIENNLEHSNHLTIKKQTGTFMAEEIQKIMQNIGIEKFVVIVTDHGTNLRVARRIIHEKYPFILDLRCMAHAINLIASDFAEIDSVKKIISNCGNIIEFFNNSYAAHGYYKEQLNIMKIKGGEIQSYYKTRWGTLYTIADFIIRSKPVFNWILENHPQIITNKNVFTLLQNEGFYFNCYQITSILKPVKELTNILEARNTNLADCFIGLIKLGAKINQIQQGNQWKSIIISNYNRCLEEFINNINILAYWLHPLYRDNSEESCLNLLMEMRSWKRKVAPYDLSFNSIQETPMKWWLTVCERNFSMLKWFLGERRTSLTLLKIESMAKIHFYYISNTDKEIHFCNKNLSEDELRKSIDKFVVTYDIFKNEILERNENLEQENLNGSEENTEDENISSTILNINQFVNLTLPEFLSTGNNLFESITNRSNINERNERVLPVSPVLPISPISPVSPVSPEQENLNGSEENTEDENISSTILNINQFVNLTLPEFLSTGNNLFESITNRSNINERNERGNMEYNPISLAQRILNEENN